MATKIALTILHLFADLFISAGLLYTFIATIGDWQAVVSLGILIMFALLRGKDLLESIAHKREDRRKKEIENKHREFELKVRMDEHEERKQNLKQK